MDVRRQRHVSERIDRRVDDPARRRPSSARAAGRRTRRSSISPRSTTPGARAGSSNTIRAPGFSFCPGCTSACQSRVVHALEQQTLDRAAARVAAPEQPRRKHARVVDDEQIAGVEQLRQRRDRRLAPAIAGAIDDHQPRRPARPRLLRDQRLGQIEVEVGDAARSPARHEVPHDESRSHSAIEDRHEQDQQPQGERDEPHERVVARRRRTAGPRVTLEQREVEVFARQKMSPTLPATGIAPMSASMSALTTMRTRTTRGTCWRTP